MAPPVSTCEQDRLGEHFSHAFRQTAISVSFTILQAASYSVYTQLYNAGLTRYSVYMQLYIQSTRSYTQLYNAALQRRSWCPTSRLRCSSKIHHLQRSSQNNEIMSRMGRYYLSSAVHIPAYIIFPAQFTK